MATQLNSLSAESRIYHIRRVGILGDPGAVSQAGRKGATKVFKHRRKSPWVPTLTGPFPSGQANVGSWLGTKNALYYCAQSANSISWVLFVSSYTTAIDSTHGLSGSCTKEMHAIRNLSVWYKRYEIFQDKWILNSSSKRKVQVFPSNVIKIDWHASLCQSLETAGLLSRF